MGNENVSTAKSNDYVNLYYRVERTYKTQTFPQHTVNSLPLISLTIAISDNIRPNKSTGYFNARMIVCGADGGLNKAWGYL